MNELNAIELTESELAQIQGGGWFSDAWNSVKNAVKKGAEAVAQGFVNQALSGAKRIFSSFF